MKGIVAMEYSRIRKLREDKDLTQEYMAQLLHVNQRTYSRYETGEHAIPLEQLCRIADFHNIYLIEQILGSLILENDFVDGLFSSFAKFHNLKVLTLFSK
mgnify:CR=1 FL=1